MLGLSPNLLCLGVQGVVLAAGLLAPAVRGRARPATAVVGPRRTVVSGPPSDPTTGHGPGRRNGLVLTPAAVVPTLDPIGAPVLAHPIGADVTRNHLRVDAVWHRAVRAAGSPPPAAGAIHLTARVHATDGNPNGFARGEWVPYLRIRYTVAPAGGGPALTGVLAPLLAADGPRYGADLTPPGPGDYRLTLRIEPPPPDALGRVVDPSLGVAPWWEPFTVALDWPYRPGS